ncbi:glutamate--cysteine ligase [Roseateles sp. DAIF2]|uniref:YbdK family carboxylate-amine ligase n=1 Tax=Roseateles sp. DAIF2 TaxID=2714952 RepID=UPI0018A3262F|nr:YbdK family carboxylate-amine ligase [Roseateles sp. DAIF2]QPF74749.1 glutamate--cysteine ligase [Roseateles sp. DAIF2]
MPLQAFGASAPLSLGVELELQLIDRLDRDLEPAATELLARLENASLPGQVSPEITLSMIEICTNVCDGYGDVLEQLSFTRDALLAAAAPLKVDICGGGTHPFQQWTQRQIYDKPRFKQITGLYGYLAKQFTVFGQHIHIGCPDGDTALWLLQAMSRYVPHFIALAASSPYVQGEDTAFQSARLNTVFAFPLSGQAPFTLSWEEFGRYFARMERTGIVAGMKDFYWDIRPKPEYGTIEIRVLDTPLTVQRAAALAGFAQCLAAWLLEERPIKPHADDQLVYTYNRFQACRFGLDAQLVDPQSNEAYVLGERLPALLELLMPQAERLGAVPALQELQQLVARREGDADWLRGLLAGGRSLPGVVAAACERWAAAD